MRKLILPILVCLFAIGSINANNTTNNPKNNTTVTYNVSSFCKLIQKGNYEAVKFLLETGEDVNEMSKGLTPLMFAARHNKAEIAKLLIESGAKLEVKSNKESMTALEVAKRFKAKDALEVIEIALKK